LQKEPLSAQVASELTATATTEELQSRTSCESGSHISKGCGFPHPFFMFCSNCHRIRHYKENR
jgi:hypothetical protein